MKFINEPISLYELSEDCVQTVKAKFNKVKTVKQFSESEKIEVAVPAGVHSRLR